MKASLATIRDHLPFAVQRDRDSGPLPADASTTLQIATADLLLTTGLGSWLEGRRRRRSTYAADALRIGGTQESRRTRPLYWAPALLGCAGAAAHLAHAFAPTSRTRMAARTFDTAAVAVGLLAFTDGIVAAGQRRSSLPTAPLSLASAGIIGLLLDRAHTEHTSERKQLERRARIVERLVPQRRTRFDRVVVHI